MKELIIEENIHLLEIAITIIIIEEEKSLYLYLLQDLNQNLDKIVQIDSNSKIQNNNNHHPDIIDPDLELLLLVEGEDQIIIIDQDPEKIEIDMKGIIETTEENLLTNNNNRVEVEEVDKQAEVEVKKIEIVESSNNKNNNNNLKYILID